MLNLDFYSKQIKIKLKAKAPIGGKTVIRKLALHIVRMIDGLYIDQKRMINIKLIF